MEETNREKNPEQNGVGKVKMARKRKAYEQKSGRRGGGLGRWWTEKEVERPIKGGGVHGGPVKKGEYLRGKWKRGRRKVGTKKSIVLAGNRGQKKN